MVTEPTDLQLSREGGYTKKSKVLSTIFLGRPKTIAKNLLRRQIFTNWVKRLLCTLLKVWRKKQERKKIFTSTANFYKLSQKVAGHFIEGLTKKNKRSSIKKSEIWLQVNLIGIICWVDSISASRQFSRFEIQTIRPEKIQPIIMTAAVAPTCYELACRGLNSIRNLESVIAAKRRRARSAPTGYLNREIAPIQIFSFESSVL